MIRVGKDLFNDFVQIPVETVRKRIDTHPTRTTVSRLNDRKGLSALSAMSRPGHVAGEEAVGTREATARRTR
jgi:hypothetical protein